MMQNVKHIDIPFDELKIFTAGEEDQFQEVLIETLLLSTLAVVHWGKKIHKAKIFVTAKSCWLLKSELKRYKINLSEIVCIVKANGHPQIVLMTSNKYDNVRLSGTSEQRCWAIISAISYQFTYMQDHRLTMINVDRSSSLGYFQRSAEEKMKGKNINLEPYPKQEITYAKPFIGISDIYGHFPAGVKAILEKQIPIENRYGREDHTVYVARMQQAAYKVDQNGRKSNKNRQSFIKSDNDQTYICHYIEKKQEYLQQLYEHRNIQFIQQLAYVRATDYKIKVFFQFYKGIRGKVICQQIFSRIWELYDLGKKIDPNCVITADCFVISAKNSFLVADQDSKFSQTESERSKNSSRKGSESLQKGKGTKIEQLFLNDRNIDLNEQIQDEQYTKKQEINLSQNKLVLKQFRYQFLLDYEKEIQKFRYEDIPAVQSNTDQSTKYLRRKMHNIGNILYQLTMGKNLLDFEILEPELCNPFMHTHQNKQKTMKRKQSKSQKSSSSSAMKKNINQLKSPQEQLEILRKMKVLMHLKQRICYRQAQVKDIKLFPRHMKIQIDSHLQNFIQKLIFKQFRDEAQIFYHPWFTKRKGKQTSH